MKKLATLIVIVAASVTACAANDGYRDQGGYSVEQRTYGSSYGGATWYREEVPYHPDYDRNRNGIPDSREMDRNGIPDNREIDRNRNGIPDKRETDRNHNGVPDQRELDRNRNSVPDYKERDHDRDGIPDNKDRRPGNFYSR